MSGLDRLQYDMIFRFKEAKNHSQPATIREEPDTQILGLYVIYSG